MWVIETWKIGILEGKNGQASTRFIDFTVTNDSIGKLRWGEMRNYGSFFITRLASVFKKMIFISLVFFLILVVFILIYLITYIMIHALSLPSYFKPTYSHT